MDFPFNVEQLYGTRGRVPMLATFDGVPYRGSMVNMGNESGCHMVLILKAIREQIGKQAGDAVHVTVALDTKPRTVEVPADLQKALEENPTANAKFEKMAYSHQREYTRWIEEAKQDETRQRRITQTIERILS